MFNIRTSLLALAAVASIGTALVTSTTSADARPGFGGFRGGIPRRQHRARRRLPPDRRPASLPALPSPAALAPASAIGTCAGTGRGSTASARRRSRLRPTRRSRAPARRSLHLPEQGVHAGQRRGVQGPLHQRDGGGPDGRAAAEPGAARRRRAGAAEVTGRNVLKHREPRPASRGSPRSIHRPRDCIVWLFCTRRRQRVPRIIATSDGGAVMTMKLKVIAGAGALVWMSAVGPVLAADIPAAPVVKAPVAVAPSQSWYGFYIGINGGYAWGRNSVTFAPDPFFAGPFLRRRRAAPGRGRPEGLRRRHHLRLELSVRPRRGRHRLGLQLLRHQVVADRHRRVRRHPVQRHHIQKLSWFSTTRLRGGILLSDNWLLYVTGGLASGRGESQLRHDAGRPRLRASRAPARPDRPPRTCGAGRSAAASNTPPGPGSSAPNTCTTISARSTTSSPIRCCRAPSIAASTKFSGDMVRGAITYRFNWTPLGLIFGSDRI